jgi:hypothetical protein
VVIFNEPKFSSAEEEAAVLGGGLQITRATYYTVAGSSAEGAAGGPPSPLSPRGAVLLGVDVTDTMRRLCNGKLSVAIHENKVREGAVAGLGFRPQKRTRVCIHQYRPRGCSAPGGLSCFGSFPTWLRAPLDSVQRCKRCEPGEKGLYRREIAN